MNLKIQEQTDYYIRGNLQFTNPPTNTHNGNYTLIVKNKFGSHNMTTRAIFLDNSPGEFQ